MSKGTWLAVKASGLVTPVGFNSRATCAALRAGIRNVQESPLWEPESGTFLTVGKVPLPHWWEGIGKLAELVAPAIYECLEVAGDVDSGSIPLLLGVAAEDRPCRLPDLERQILGEIEHRLQVRFHPSSEVIPHGRVSGFRGLERSAELLRGEDLQLCIVAGVDSFLSQAVVDHYLGQRRLLSPLNSNGFTPGEAGAACLVGLPAESGSNELHISLPGFGIEEGTIESEEPLRGDALTSALDQVFSETGLGVLDMAYRMTDLNGEHYKFKEALIADQRFVRPPKETLYDIWHPIEYVGDVGAAIGPLMFAWALHAAQRDYAVGPNVLFHAGSDNGERAAAIGRAGWIEQ